MELLQYKQDLKFDTPLTCTIGIFEGVHTAHKALINKCVKLAKKTNTKSMIITFNILSKISKSESSIPLLSEEDKYEMMKDLGIDYVLVIDLDDEFKNKSHEEFAELLLSLNIKNLVVGFDFTYGKDRLGNINTISVDTNNQIKPIIIKEKKLLGKKIGTTEIKEYLKVGNIKKANKLLGYNFFVTLDTSIKSNQLELLCDKTYNVIIDGFKTSVNVVDNTIDLMNLVSKIDKPTKITFIK